MFAVLIDVRALSYTSAIIEVSTVDGSGFVERKGDGLLQRHRLALRPGCLPPRLVELGARSRDGTFMTGTIRKWLHRPRGSAQCCCRTRKPCGSLRYVLGAGDP